ncbi:hypothetical protein ROZALSC1DRAFT_26018 [Rozella allomycis CSF55]|uniref:Reverse transcriptase zinc-binding domain-containing protein n=1 Tax=Rozella allomycis (strain CSF55) TaxID=988480 RepID=A0A4P9Y9S6_ROZAC|nr:hypothetical protein ROZALSC1DRAFT_26018 [Rozella allomycis CSF55]
MHQVFNTLRQNDLESKYHPDELRFISMHNSVITCTNTDKQSDLSFRLKLLTQRLPVNDNLYRYKKVLSPICPRCKTENETIEHIFICNHSIQVWESLIETFLLQYNNTAKHKICPLIFNEILTSFLHPHYLCKRPFPIPEIKTLLATTFNKSMKAAFIISNEILDIFYNTFRKLIWSYRNTKSYIKFKTKIVTIKLPHPQPDPITNDLRPAKRRAYTQNTVRKRRKISNALAEIIAFQTKDVPAGQI